MDAVTTFLHMGGYAAWVWSAYGLAAAGLFGLLFLSRRTLKARERELAALKGAPGHRP